MYVELIYPALETSEHLLADEAVPRTASSWGKAELRQHSGLIPLAPGDIVEFDALDVVRNVVHLEPLFTFEVEFKLPADITAGEPLPADHPAMRAIGELEEQWRREGWVTRPTNFTMLVSAQSMPWLKDRILKNPLVEHAQMIRTPETALKLDVAVRHPDLDGRGGGPWS